MDNQEPDSQDAQVWMTPAARDRLNKLKPDFTFSNKSGVLNFLIDIYELVKPLIADGSDIHKTVLDQILDELHQKSKYFKNTSSP